MDETFHDLEAELKALQLRPPSARLTERLAADLAAGSTTAPLARPRDPTSANFKSWPWLNWRTVGLAAAVAVVATVGLVSFTRRPAPDAGVNLARFAPVAPGPGKPAFPTSAPGDRFQPVAATNVLYDVQDEGPVEVDGVTAARRVRARYLDTYTWKNPATNASLKWSVPRDEIRFVSASLN